ncbi:MAG TPA: hypothetical protein VLA31_01320, partial [Burkholderiaceae bacterium]|nr:hypothetical protein [Burkholderiaceae bacterium]
METARFRYLRSADGGGWSIPELANLVAELEDAGPRFISTLSWRVSGTLQQMFGLHTLFPGHPLTADPHFEEWTADLSATDQSILLDLTAPAVAKELSTPELLPTIPSSRTVVVSAGRLPRALEKALSDRRFEPVLTIPSKSSGQYRHNWWHSGSRDEPEAMSALQVWLSEDLLFHPALTRPYAHFGDNLSYAMAEYPLPPREPEGYRSAPVPHRWAAYLRHTETGWAT